jgi:hypothetical protein
MQFGPQTGIPAPCAMAARRSLKDGDASPPDMARGEDHGGPGTDGDRLPERVLQPLVSDRQHRKVRGGRHVGEAGEARETLELGAPARIDRVRRACKTAAADHAKHVVARRVHLGARTDEGDRAWGEKWGEKWGEIGPDRPWTGTAASGLRPGGERRASVPVASGQPSWKRFHSASYLAE